MRAEELLASPRGCRMLLEFALESERTLVPEFSDWKLYTAVADSAYQLDSGRGVSTVRMGFGGSAGEEATPEGVASCLNATSLMDVSLDFIINVLATAVDSAMYWQEPHGEDVLAATPAVKQELRRVAEHILGSSHTHWICAAFDASDQWQVEFLRPDFPSIPSQPAVAILKQDRAHAKASEARAASERPADITASMTGAWWSIPPSSLPSTSRSMDGTPAGLLFIEDTLGIEQAVARQLLIPADARVYEIDGAGSWAQLCRTYPRVVTHEKRHDWYRTTGRDGEWVMPDWSLVATDFHGVHLTVAGYLSAAGTAIPVESSTASVIAGWNPDQTWWLRDMESLGEDKYWEWGPQDGWSLSATPFP